MLILCFTVPTASCRRSHWRQVPLCVGKNSGNHCCLGGRMSLPRRWGSLQLQEFKKALDDNSVRRWWQVDMIVGIKAYSPLCMGSCSVAQSCQTLCDPMAPLPMAFSRQGYWSRLPFPPPGDLPNPGIKLTSLVPPALAGGFLTTEPSRKPIFSCVVLSNPQVLEILNLKKTSTSPMLLSKTGVGKL